MRAVAQIGVRHGARMPELGDDAPAGRMDGIGDAPPAANLVWLHRPGVSAQPNPSGLIALASVTIRPAAARWA